MRQGVQKRGMAAMALLVGIYAAGGCATPAPDGNVSPPRIALVGDSWSTLMRVHHGFQNAFVDEGYKMRQVRWVAIGWSPLDGSRVHLSSAGAEADELHKARFKRQLAETLDTFPTIDIIHLSLGGADVLHDINPRVSPEIQEAYMRTHVVPHIREVIDFIRENYPEKHVALVGYDYLNFRDTHEKHWRPIRKRSTTSWTDSTRFKKNSPNESALCLSIAWVERKNGLEWLRTRPSPIPERAFGKTECISIRRATSTWRGFASMWLTASGSGL